MIGIHESPTIPLKGACMVCRWRHFQPFVVFVVIASIIGISTACNSTNGNDGASDTSTNLNLNLSDDGDTNGNNGETENDGNGNTNENANDSTVDPGPPPSDEAVCFTGMFECSIGPDTDRKSVV